MFLNIPQRFPNSKTYLHSALEETVALISAGDHLSPEQPDCFVGFRRNAHVKAVRGTDYLNTKPTAQRSSDAARPLARSLIRGCVLGCHLITSCSLRTLTASWEPMWPHDTRHSSPSFTSQLQSLQYFPSYRYHWQKSANVYHSSITVVFKLPGSKMTWYTVHSKMPSWYHLI